MSNVLEFPRGQAAEQPSVVDVVVMDRYSEAVASAAYFANAIIGCVKHGITPAAFLKEADAYINGVPVTRYKNGKAVE